MRSWVSAGTRLTSTLAVLSLQHENVISTTRMIMHRIQDMATVWSEVVEVPQLSYVPCWANEVHSDGESLPSEQKCPEGHTSGGEEGIRQYFLSGHGMFNGAPPQWAVSLKVVIVPYGAQAPFCGKPYIHSAPTVHGCIQAVVREQMQPGQQGIGFPNVDPPSGKELSYIESKNPATHEGS